MRQGYDDPVPESSVTKGEREVQRRVELWKEMHPDDSLKNHVLSLETSETTEVVDSPP